MRNHIMYITSERWKDKDLVQSIKSQARQHAGNNPGMQVTVKREITTVAPPGTLYKSSRRGRGTCVHCCKPFAKHAKHSPYECPNNSYWEVVWKFTNHSKRVIKWV